MGENRNGRRVVRDGDPGLPECPAQSGRGTEKIGDHPVASIEIPHQAKIGPRFEIAKRGGSAAKVTVEVPELIFQGKIEVNTRDGLH